MKRIVIFFLLVSFTLFAVGQTPKTTTKRKAKTATTSSKKKAAAQKRNAGTTKKGKDKSGTATYSTKEIKGLQSQRAQIQKKIKEQEQLLRVNKEDVKKRLDNLFVINSEIEEHQKSIDGIQHDITHINGNINLLKAQLTTLEQQLQDRKAKFVQSMRYMARHRSIQDQLMFIFSAKNFAQMYRRMRFVREYAAYQRAQGELVKAKQQQITSKHEELQKVKGEKNILLYKGKRAQVALQGKQEEQQQVVTSLQKQQKTIQGIIADQRRKDQALNAQIDRLVAEEVAKARIRAAEEARRKAAEAAAAKKKREEELARKKAAAEAAARENQRRIDEAKAREARLKAEAREAEKRDTKEKELAARRANEAQAEREAVERKAAVEKQRNEKELSEAKRANEAAATLNTEDRMLSNNFASNKGRLPMPISGSYKIVSHYGQYCVEGLKGVTLDNKGINILGTPGAQARSIFNGEVSAVFAIENTMVVMVRHGSYISVYCNLRSVNVHRGQRVTARQSLGTVAPDNILQFQLRRETAKLNPEVWLGR
ncbi:MAG: peptidoglycan DD-metalloendopeptidase family protein [Prevotellaceae bacterium]|nr:peptidoglycan DD-metalloendopeptidase family protein [Prevotella sp.]MDD7258096.1 peptidoglycan DD-metalloendopeptidase family protein [Prevotellaceae bacterium]MDY6129735.1 peptidoglycan DD-metalloendopeptidase family protein [Prevotella sp.]